MSYITPAQKDWIRMVYGEDSYETLLDTFGRLVEQVVLPAEKNTEIQRAKNSCMIFKEKFHEEEERLKNSLRDLCGNESDNGKFPNEVYGLMEKTLDTIGKEIKREEGIPDEVYTQIVENGLPGAPFPEDLGGMDLPYPVYIALLETLGKASPSVGVRYAISNTCAEGLRFNYQAGVLSKYGENILRDLVAGEKLAAFGLTEPSAAGSNIMQEMATRAVLDEDKKRYILNGNKMFITNAGSADVFAIFARTSDDPRHGISLFLVEKETQGFSIGQIFETRVVENSSLGELVLNEVKVPLENLVGKEGQGIQYAVRMLNSGRITIAALAVGLAQRGFEEYLEVAVEGKKCADKRLIEYDRTKVKIAEMSMEINAARDMTYRAAWLKERFDSDPQNQEILREYVIESNGAKLKASLVAQKACDYLVKIGGASSVVKETFSIKHYLDTFLYYFGEAVPEVLENTIANMEVKRYKAGKGL
ncbi:MAG: acyl-CoA dehydrogenase family protein [Nitrospinae bacterium]|nr:acyl-CoA dehydrogenase family protein [Nitrospinota bacterium]